jgi:hypothetical protein
MAIVKTFELRVNGIVWATGSVKTLAEFAYYELHRKDRSIPDDTLDALERSLRKTKTAQHGELIFSIVPIEEEYEADEEE